MLAWSVCSSDTSFSSSDLELDVARNAEILRMQEKYAMMAA